MINSNGDKSMTDNEIPIDIDHAKHSVGGLGGHFFRRFTHVFMAIIPILYFIKGENLADFFSLTPNELVTYACLSLVFLEMIRLYFGIIIIELSILFCNSLLIIFYQNFF